MKKSFVFGMAAGIAAMTAAAVAAGKISKEMKSSLVEKEFDSPFGDNWIKIYSGHSQSAKGLAYIKVVAETDSNEDSCKIVFLTRKDAEVTGQWTDNEHFTLTAGSGKIKQFCDVTFETKTIKAVYYLKKVNL